jgi:hypothetical protein
MHGHIVGGRLEDSEEVSDRVEELASGRLAFIPAGVEAEELGVWGFLIDVEEPTVFLLVERESLTEKLDYLIKTIAGDRERIVGMLARTIDSDEELRKALEDKAGNPPLEELLEKSSLVIFVT